MNLPYLGEILATFTAITWATAVILFKKSGETVHPIALNLFKNSLSFLLLIPTLWIVGQTLFHQASWSEYGLLLFSGAIGIGVADTLFFRSLNLLGASLSAIVDCMYSPFVILLSVLYLGDVLDVWQIVGVVLILAAVLAVSKRGAVKISRQDLIKGIALAATAMFLTAVGIVIVKPLLNRSPLMWVVTVRMIGGVVILLLIMVFHNKKRKILSSLNNRQGWAFTLSGSFMGAYVAMILWVAGMKFTEQTSIAASLNQTSNIFVFLLAVFILKEPLTPHKIAGIAIGVTGAFLVTFGKLL